MTRCRDTQQKRSKISKILVTGGAGFIGSFLVQGLLELKHEVVILDDFSAGMMENLVDVRGKPVEIVKGTVASREIVEYCSSGVDMVYHLAAKTNVDESLHFPLLFDEVNSRGTLNVLEGARKNDADVVHMSTSEVYGSALTVPMSESHPLNPQSPYAASKVAAERYCYSYISSYGARIAIIRSFNNYGPRQKGNADYGGLIARNIIRTLAGLPPIIRGQGGQVRDYVFVKDTVNALLALLSHPSSFGKVLNIGTGEEHSANELVTMILEIANSKLSPVVDRMRPGDVERLVCDATKAREELAWSPKVSMRRGLRETISWYKKDPGRHSRYIFPSFKQRL